LPHLAAPFSTVVRHAPVSLVVSDNGSDHLLAALPSVGCEVCVIVPARDEAAALDNTLRALACQIDGDGRAFAHERYEIVLLANNCRDESAAVARIRHSPAVQVVTSGRRDARARIGLATQLGEWATMDREGQPWLVESVSSLEERLCARRALRRLGTIAEAGSRPRARDVDALADTLGLDRRWLSDRIAHPTPYGLLIDDVERRQAEESVWTLDLVEITAAIAALRQRLARPHHDARVLS